tara:strand:+ start:239 stop:670 length:432 start_codon:yes stop_codon:yes gene_type:complete
MTPLTVLIAGEPVAKGRPRVVRTKAGVRAITPEKTREWTSYAVRVLAWSWKGRPPIAGPVKVTLRAIKTRPQRLRRKSDAEGLCWRTTKPDVDNVAKAVLDALVKAQVIADDQQVARLECDSLYAEKQGLPRVEVTVSTLEAL